eukprot:9067323-Karenia_brevis.AAC.1
MTAARQRKLRTCQRRMLRLMVRVGRRLISYENEDGKVTHMEFGSYSDNSSEVAQSDTESAKSAT